MTFNFLPVPCSNLDIFCFPSQFQHFNRLILLDEVLQCFQKAHWFNIRVTVVYDRHCSNMERFTIKSSIQVPTFKGLSEKSDFLRVVYHNYLVTGCPPLVLKSTLTTFSCDYFVINAGPNSPHTSCPVPLSLLYISCYK